MNLQEISAAVDRGDTVHWKTTAYTVTKGPSHPDSPNRPRYLITCKNGSAIGLTWRDGITLNGKEEDFFSPASA